VSDPASADTSFRSSLTRHASGALGLVVVVAVLFWAIGALGGDDDDLTAATEPTIDGADDVDDLDDLDPDGGDDPGAEPPDPDAEAETDGSSDADDGDTDEGDNDEGATDDADDDAGDDGDEDTEDETPRIDPATISVQVLDGYQADGGAAADQVAQQLDDEGYDIIARNPALRYDVTTVLWTAGFEDEGRQVAADIGAAEAREQPGTLSDAVAVHVVVGADRG
jgi:hypothetical protein